MSAPGNEFREAEYLGLGYLAVTSSELLDQLLSGVDIDDDDKYTLRRAKGFLNDVSSGARLVTSGVSSNVSAVDSVRKLSFAVEPLKLMHEEVLKSADLGEAFEKMANSIDAAIGNSLTNEDRNYLIAAKDFFRQLHLFFINLVEAGQRRTGIDIGFQSMLVANA